MTRTDNSIRNMKYAVIGQVLGMVMSFVTRRVFVDMLPEEYLGVNGLFMSVINMLSLAELGIGASIIYSLYKPLAMNDEKKIALLMNLFRKTYHLIGVIVAVIGVLIMPLLPVIIEDLQSIPNAYLLYLLFLLNSVLSYFYVYKQSLLSADQKEYINTNVRTLFIIILNIVQIIVLFLTQNYIMFLIVQIVITLTINMTLAKRVDKLYPFLKEKQTEKLSKEDIQEIKRNVSAMMMHRVGGFVLNGTDVPLIGILTSMTVVGFYSNYLMVLNGLFTMYALIFASMTASVGNLGVTSEGDYLKEKFNIVNFLGFWIYGFSAICLYILFNPFIELWVGSDLLLSQNVVMIIVINFYLRGMRQGAMTFKDTLGLFWYDRHKPIIEAIINLMASWVLGSRFGLFGILAGTTISTLMTSFWIEPFVLYKYGFKTSVSDFFKRYSLYTIAILLIFFITRFIVSFIPAVGIIGFSILAIVTAGISNLLLLLFFHRLVEFKELFKMVKLKILKRA